MPLDDPGRSPGGLEHRALRPRSPSFPRSGKYDRLRIGLPADPPWNHRVARTPQQICRREAHMGLLDRFESGTERVFTAPFARLFKREQLQPVEIGAAIRAASRGDVAELDQRERHLPRPPRRHRDRVIPRRRRRINSRPGDKL